MEELGVAAAQPSDLPALPPQEPAAPTLLPEESAVPTLPPDPPAAAQEQVTVPTELTDSPDAAPEDAGAPPADDFATPPADDSATPPAADVATGATSPSSAPPAESAAARWGDLVDDARVVELDALRRSWEADPGGRPAPFAGIRLTGADVFFLAVQAVAGAAGDVAIAAEQLRAARHDVGLRFMLDLSALHLDGADLRGADLEGAALRGAHLSAANLQRADLRRANLQGADLDQADLTRAQLRVANLEGASLRGANLQRANLGGATLTGAALRRATLERAVLVYAHLEGANLRGAQLAGANLAEAFLDGAFMGEAGLQGANLSKARLMGANLTRAHLEGANLRLAIFDATTQLNEVFLDRATLAHVSFGGADLTAVYWGEVQRLGDEVEARRPRTIEVVYADDDWRVQKTGMPKKSWMISGEYTDAARAYRALSVALRAQGLSKDATRFHYRSELMARQALFYDIFARLLSARFSTVPWVFGRWVVSLLLDTLVGYGDYIGRLFGTYLLVVVGFALAYLPQLQAPLTLPHLLDALALSVTAFHGHGLTPPGITLTQGMIWQASAESVIGLLIEALFVAAFTRRITGN